LDETIVLTDLSPGAQLGPYRIEALLGAGGMGRVYKAHDTRLGRTVAIKVSREEFNDRFQREARTIAALNHPHICTVHDVGPNYLVMEYLDGTELKGPLPLERVLEYGSQICDALDAAHRKGIVHRDVKRSNMLVTRSGVKVLDFGLAKACGDETMTQVGVVVGTPAYMAPEQWQGKETDARSDIYSLGCVIYELATGERWQGRTLESAPLDRVVRTCVAADPKDRWQSTREVKLALELARSAALKEPANSPAGTLPHGLGVLRSLLPALIVATVLIFVMAVWLSRRSPPAFNAASVSTIIPIPLDQELLEAGTVPFDISLDGTKLVYVASNGGRRKLYLRLLDGFDVRPLPGSEDAVSPFFSPDGRWVGFFVQRRLFKISTSGGSPVLIGEIDRGTNGASWGPNDTIVYGTALGLMSIPASGGKASPLTSLGAGETGHAHPRFIDQSDVVLFTIVSKTYRRQVAAMRLRDQKPKLLLDGQQPTYLDGRLVYATNDVLRAVPFDVTKLQIAGGSFTLLDDVYTAQLTSQTYFRITRSGTLIYVAGRNEHSLVRVDRAGRSAPVTQQRAGYRLPRVSRDGRFAAVTIDPPDEGESHIWILDLQRGVFSKLTQEGHNLEPVFNHDGSRVAWSDWKQGPKVFWQATDGSGQRERISDLDAATASDFSPDGKHLIMMVSRAPTHLWVLPLSRDKKPFPLIQETYSTTTARFSADGRWLTYASEETGRSEIYIRHFLNSDGKRIVSTNGGRFPVWSRDGREIFYLEGIRMMAVRVTAGGPFSAATPVFLFERPELAGGYPSFDVLDDGFLMVQRDPLSMLTEFRMVQNWPTQWNQ
jgi:eukaryotic-like serine/threonine-protein kinase